MWDFLSFQGGTHYTIHWAGKVDVGFYDKFLAFLSFPRDAFMKVTVVIDGNPIFLTERGHGAENQVELKGSFHFQDEGEEFSTVECEEGREYEQMGYGNLVLEEKKEG